MEGGWGQLISKVLGSLFSDKKDKGDKKKEPSKSRQWVDEYNRLAQEINTERMRNIPLTPQEQALQMEQYTPAPAAGMPQTIRPVQSQQDSAWLQWFSPNFQRTASRVGTAGRTLGLWK